MTTIRYQGKRFPLLPQESVLDGLLRSGEEVPHGCRSGVCRACTMICTDGEVPAEAQEGLREVERRKGMFLACQCRPSTELELRRCGEGEQVRAELVEHERLTDSVVRLRLRPETPLDYEAGQFVALQREDGVTRSFSLASLPSDPWLELHVRHVPGGMLSSWLYEEAEVGTQFSIQGPHGTCCYPSEALDTPLLLAGVGTGLAPLWGVLRSALAAGHRAPIHLVLGARDPAGFYMLDALQALVAAHPTVDLRLCVLRDAPPDSGMIEGPLDFVATKLVEQSPDPAAWMAFVCGDPGIVKSLRFALFLAGVSGRRILADEFLPAPKAASKAAAV